VIDRASILAQADIVALVERYCGVTLKKHGKEYRALCPFHSESSPSFYVNTEKVFAHCFGCGAHYDAISLVMHFTECSFLQACEVITGRRLAPDVRNPIKRAERVSRDRDMPLWVPILPPDDAPVIVPGVEFALWNPNRNREWRCTPTRADAYRDARGALLGYVLRVEFDDGKKVTPQVTWCVGPDGSQRWCSQPFPRPRPMCGLDDMALERIAISGPDGRRFVLARRGDIVELDRGEEMASVGLRPVLIVEGEKCRAAGAGALPTYAVASWPGGSQGIGYVDWSPLCDRDVILWPDADEAGQGAMLGKVRPDGMSIDGIAQHAARAGCRSIRVIDTQGMPKGWDIADAIDEGWSPRQLATWAASRVRDVTGESGVSKFAKSSFKPLTPAADLEAMTLADLRERKSHWANIAALASREAAFLRRKEHQRMRAEAKQA